MRSNKEGNERLSDSSESGSTSGEVAECELREILDRFPNLQVSPQAYLSMLCHWSNGGVPRANLETAFEELRLRMVAASYDASLRRQKLHSLLKSKTRKRGTTRIVRRPPGALMLRIAEVLCTSKRLEDVYKPIIADYQHEYFEALKSGNTPRILFVKVRHYWGFLKATGLAAWAFGCVAAVLKYLKGAS